MAAPGDSPALLSVCIPCRDEEESIGEVIDEVAAVLRLEGIPHEFVIANDNSTDGTEAVVRRKMGEGHPIRLINRKPPGGFGRAVRSCLDHFQGDALVIVMADLSDDPRDVVGYYRKLAEGFDAVFGSRFSPGGDAEGYPRGKLLANRLGNKLIQLLFRTEHNDLTNAFKAYSRRAVQSLMPLYASHFNITIEMSLGLLIRDFRIAAMPVRWYTRTKGLAKFRLRELGRRYLATLVKIYVERKFIHDDVIAEHGRRLESLRDGERTREELVTNIHA